MTSFPLPFLVTRIRHDYNGVDELGNEKVQVSESHVRVAGWALPTSDEPKVAGHDRLTVDMELYAPVGQFREDDQVRIDGHGILNVIGYPENYESNPFGWMPGLEVVNLARKDRP